ncbi:prepilin peptidase [Chitinibacter fontanus]|uniref:Prepilin leader peptidase/N-methyltransferase n=1 Tax=Chitinibacter fontanus TaxID=1737446 RepID=A0A7D5ZE94_9NEIS|nr:A24 family peptidase [Chitinibacter fontanus]QLI81946.1 prepilin peptidase [Chitinibacter fontanus]
MMELLATNYGVVGICAVLGLMVGSFLNVVIHRLPIMIERNFRTECQLLDQNENSPSISPTTEHTYNLATPRSACPQCGHQISALENIPLVSWMVLGGKCSQCKSSISIRYPLVELVCSLISAGLAWHFGFSIALLGALLLSWSLIALILIDADTYLLPDDITLPLVWLGLLFNLQGTFTTIDSAVYGAIAGYMSLWSIYWLFKLITGKEGMGYGDFKLLAALGAWLGIAMLPAIILLSSLSGAIIGIAMICGAKHGWNKPLPFGPYLGIAGFLALIWGKDISQMLYGI